MVVDSSALIAVLWNEPERDQFRAAIATARVCVISTASVVETSMVVLSHRKGAGLIVLDGLLRGLRITQVALTADHVDFAVDAFRRFGKGRHPAGLNLGDCFSYALAKATGEPLLFKGDDFALTDVKRAA